MSNPFHFKKFSIVQENAAMKVGTDSVLLGSWVSAVQPTFILDIGCGTGLLCLMMAQRFPKAQIIGIEIEDEAIIDAEFNIKNSDWKDRIHVQNADFSSVSFSQSFDLILSNPPYFPSDTASPINKRSVARNGMEFSFLDWLEKAKEILNPKGVIAFVLPIIQWNDIENSLVDYGLYVNRIRKVKPKEYKLAHRVLVELGKNPVTSVEEDVLIIEREKRHDYSDEYKELTSSFYLDKN